MGLLQDDLYGYGPAPAPTEAELDRALIGHLTKGGLLGSMEHMGKGLLRYMGKTADSNAQAVKRGADATLKKLKGKALTPEEEAASAENPAMGIGTADIAGPGVLAGTFAGKMAKTADHAKLAEAQELLKKGASEAEIRGRTGWWKGQDGNWRFEIPDNNLRITGDSFEHPELFEAYPELKEDLSLRQYSDSEVPPEIWGYQNPETGEVGVRRRLGDTNKRKVLAHELQHVVQDEEGFAKGTSPWSPETIKIGMQNLNENFRQAQRVVSEYEAAKKDFLKRSGVTGDPPPDLLDQFHQWYPDLAGSKQQADAFINGIQDEEMAPRIAQQFFEDVYYRTHGEVEARAVTDRLDYTPEQRRMTPPLDTQNLDAQEIIVPPQPKSLLDWFR
jgi:hypothetical protein